MNKPKKDEAFNLVSLEELKDEGYVSEFGVEEYSGIISSMPNETAFELFQAHRHALIGKLMPLFPKKFLEEREQEIAQDYIDQIKRLGFFSEGYIDNLIIYFEVLKAPILKADYLTKIIDKYVKPDIRLQGIQPLQKFAIGYFCHELVKYGATKRPIIQMMMKKFCFSKAEVEKAVKDYKIVSEYTEKTPSSYYIVDFVGLLLLYEGKFLIEDGLNVFGNHHHAKTAKAKFLAAYDKFSKRIDQAYIPAIKESFLRPPYLLDQVIIPELKDYIAEYDGTNYQRNDINIHAGTILSYTLLTTAPNLMNDEDRLKEIGWIKE